MLRLLDDLERARLARLRREELEGKLLPANEVRAARTTIYAAIRNRLLVVPSKCAPRFAKPAEAEQIIRVRRRPPHLTIDPTMEDRAGEGALLAGCQTARQQPCQDLDDGFRRAKAAIRAAARSKI